VSFVARPVTIRAPNTPVASRKQRRVRRVFSLMFWFFIVGCRVGCDNCMSSVLRRVNSGVFET
jgi:hypothetical protein